MGNQNSCSSTRRRLRFCHAVSQMPPVGANVGIGRPSQPVSSLPLDAPFKAAAASRAIGQPFAVSHGTLFLMEGAGLKSKENGVTPVPKFWAGNFC
ncbi:hypothetical protein VTK26DRAFT_651 [Humicola hyalothermophila]